MIKRLCLAAPPAALVLALALALTLAPRSALSAAWDALAPLPPEKGYTKTDAEPFGDCCVADVTMIDASSWSVLCGSCATKPGQVLLRQPDLTRSIYVLPDGRMADTRYDAARMACDCPSKDALRSWEKSMRVYPGY